jgi:hypothetical protein
LTVEEVKAQQRLLRALPVDALPAAWGLFRVVCEV